MRRLNVLLKINLEGGDFKIFFPNWYHASNCLAYGRLKFLAEAKTRKALTAKVTNQISEPKIYLTSIVFVSQR